MKTVLTKALDQAERQFSVLDKKFNLFCDGKLKLTLNQSTRMQADLNTLRSLHTNLRNCLHDLSNLNSE